jgi:diketogulonate reductase-like aldo/keto reductase
MHETWAAMEALHQSGLAKHVGVCNLTTAGLRDVLSMASAVEHQPEVLQVERHVYLQQPKLLRMANEVCPCGSWVKC